MTDLVDAVRLDPPRPLGVAHMLAEMLESEGIPTRVQDAMGGIIMHVDVPIGFLWVGRDDRARAESLVERTLDARPVPSLAAGPWTCPSCSTAGEPAFDACWHCGAERPVTPGPTPPPPAPT